MEGLFAHMTKEANAKVLFEKNVFDVLPSSGAFHQQPHYVKKILRKENILINGKSRVIRRVYCRYDGFLEYQNVGWVLFTDVQHCMVCQKPFPRLVGRRLGRKKHCHVCGNIVCAKCLNRNSLNIVEFNRKGSFVDACASCYWGQDEISIGSHDEQVFLTTEVEEETNDLGGSQNKVITSNDNDKRSISPKSNSSISDVYSVEGDEASEGSIESNASDIDRVIDVKRVNLMMLLSTFSVLHDNDPNQPLPSSSDEDNSSETSSSDNGRDNNDS